MDHLEVVYRISGDENVEERVESVLLEQTVETPRAVAERYDFVRDHMMGSVREIVEDAEGGALATLSLPSVTASVDPAQFLNVLFGNSSLHADVSLHDFTPPAGITALLPGPRFGLTGVRERIGVSGRPLTCSALKPVGMSLADIAEICRSLARGGIDLIKDDHYLADHPFAPFEDRVRICQDAVSSAADGAQRSLYVPNLSGTPDGVRRQAETAQRAGVGAVMMAPMLLGMPTFLHICRTELDIPVLAHPSFGGVQAIRPATLYGKLFRLFGADAVIFANYGGRFSFPPAVCRDIADRLREPWLGLRSVLPVPAGGMDADRASELVEFFGVDVALLVGGSLLEAGSQLEARARQFTESVHRAAETLTNAL